ncbi:MAG: PAS domain-containing protein [Desulfobacterium sp.]|nr:PAS domain-containing protein [Desulfobacterium sp.]
MKSIGLRLGFSFITVIMFLVFQGMFAAYTTKKVYDVYGTAKQNEISAKKLQNSLMNNRLLVYRILGTFDPTEMDRLKAEHDTSNHLIRNGLEKLGRFSSDFKTLRSGYDEIITLHYDFFTHLAVKQLNTSSSDMFINLDEKLNIHVQKLAQESEKQVRHTWTTGLWFTAGVCLAALAVSFFWAVILKKTLTDRRKAQDAMVQLRRYLQNIIDSMPSILVAVDGNHVIIQWNSEAWRHTNQSFEKVAGKNILAILPVIKDEIHRLQHTLDQGVVEQCLKVADTDADPPVFWDITIYPLHVTEEPGAVIRMDNVTERVRLEDMMVQTEKMMSVGSLAAGMAHEIRNPLAGILQNLQNLERRLNLRTPNDLATAEATGLDPCAWQAFSEKRKINLMINEIRESGLRATDIVGNLLTFSRKAKSEFHQHDLAQLMNQAIELAAKDYSLKKHFDFRDITIIRQYEPSIPSFFCIGSMIQQVFLNLLKNGAQAMQENPPDKNPQFTITLFRKNDFACIDIEDNGPGMSESLRRRAFEPFFTTKGIGQGTGLGLSVSYFIITEQHHGKMTVTSVPGKGACFNICLPMENTR